jgi:hypothetical protein
MQVVGEVFALNLCLAVLATISIKTQSHAADAVLIATGTAAVALVMFRFSRSRN